MTLVSLSSLEVRCVQLFKYLQLSRVEKSLGYLAEVLNKKKLKNEMMTNDM